MKPDLPRRDPSTVEPLPAAPQPPAADERAAGSSAADSALRRVLNSGCREGLDGVYAFSEDPAVPWAATVLRLCGEILRDRRDAARASAARASATAAASADDELAVEAVAQRHEAGPPDGRGRLVVWSSFYGLWLGIATDVLAGIKGDRAVILAPMLGLSAGLGLSLQLTKGVPLTPGEAWTIITGFDYGSINGALWAGAFDGGAKGVVGTAVVSGIAATAAGLAVADAASPRAGDIELVRSGLLWGGTAGFLAVAAFSSSGHLDGSAASFGAAAGMDAGFLVTLGLARKLELSRNRVLIIDSGAIGGGLVGLSAAWLVLGSSGDNRRALTGSALAGLATGIAIAAYGTRDLDKRGHDLASAGGPVPALLVRNADGNWGAGSPAPLPVLDGVGRRVVGATVNAVGGLF